ncbi:MAG TPA: hypothetical protein PK771_16360, partial [Spirochaetota bacterium]|nr:hypothetical protein [Spirochaetota bacterium]
MQRENYFIKGLYFFKKGVYDKSLFYLNKNIKTNPTHTPSYYFLGRIFFFKKNYLFAKEYFELCISTDKNNDFFNLHLGKTLLALKEFENAIKYINIYTKTRKDGFFYLGLAYYNLNDFKTSCNCFFKCEDFLTDKKLFRIAYSASLFNYANQLYIKEDVKNAKELFLKSISLNNEAYPSYFQLGLIYLFENDFENSKKIFEFLNSV